MSNACCCGIGQRQGPTARRGGTTDVVDHDIEAAETLHDHLDDVVDPCARTDVGLHETDPCCQGQDRAVVITVPPPRLRRSTMAAPILWCHRSRARACR